jgi:quercetin dioxygenase-like cupin family protein
MEIIRISDRPLVETPLGLQARAIVDLPDVNVMNLILEPGEKVPSHSTPVNALFYVIEGNGWATIGEEKAPVTTGEIIVSPPHVPHGLEAAAGTRMNVLIIRTPSPNRIK